MSPPISSPTRNAASSFDFVAAHFACERNLYSERNPDGYVNFGSAQNFINNDLTQKRLKPLTWSDEDTHYQPFTGTDACKAAIARYLEDLSGTRVVEADVVVGNGIISLLEALTRALLKPDAKVLLPTPVFPGLVKAIALRTQTEVAFLHTEPRDEFRVTPSAVQRAMEEHAADGEQIGAILLCSPGNPVGQSFTSEEIADFLEIAERNDCALIVDEVYATSCFTGQTLQSAVSLGSQRVFVLGGLSKDFGLAGHATGWLHGLDADVMTAVAGQSHFFRLPAPLQRVIETMLERDWREDFITENRAKLTRKYESTKSAFEETGISVTPAEAGLCLWLDLRAHLTTQDKPGELSLYRHLLEKHRVHISPGTGFHCPLPGFFRMCFSQDDGTLAEGLQRIHKSLKSSIRISA